MSTGRRILGLAIIVLVLLVTACIALPLSASGARVGTDASGRRTGSLSVHNLLPFRLERAPSSGNVAIQNYAESYTTCQFVSRTTIPTQTIGFSAASYDVSEAGSTAAITVTLDATSNLTITVGYATTDHSAIAGSDYLTASGTLTFSPGLTSPVFPVSILDDTLEEPDETITLTLSTRASGTLGIPGTAILTILDDDNYVHLPFLQRYWPPIPYAPVLNPIPNPTYPGYDGDYTVDWESAELAEDYALEEATRANFSDAEVVYQGTRTWYIARNRPMGTYYYRVKASNSWGDSGWSNTQSVRAPSPPVAPVISNLGIEVTPYDPRCRMGAFYKHGLDVTFNYSDPNGDIKFNSLVARATFHPSNQTYTLEDGYAWIEQGDRFSGRAALKVLCIWFTPPDTSATLSFWVYDHAELRSNTLSKTIADPGFAASTRDSFRGE